MVSAVEAIDRESCESCEQFPPYRVVPSACSSDMPEEAMGVFVREDQRDLIVAARGANQPTQHGQVVAVSDRCVDILAVDVHDETPPVEPSGAVLWVTECALAHAYRTRPG